MRFRDRHQDPDATDLEYSARINGYDSKDDFIAALLGSPWLVTMIGFVPGLPWCYQLVPPEEQVEVPKYVRPRTFTPERAFGFGGGFAVVYSVQGAGGYQLYGMAPAPVLDVKQKLEGFRGLHCLPQTRGHLELPGHRPGGVRRDPGRASRTARSSTGKRTSPSTRTARWRTRTRTTRRSWGCSMAISVKSRACSPPCRMRAASASTPSGCRHRGRWTSSRTRSATTWWATTRAPRGWRSPTSDPSWSSPRTPS